MTKRLIDSIQNRTFEKKIRADTSLIDVENRTIPFILVSSNNAGMRSDWGGDYLEELDPNGADFSGLRTLFKDHNPSVDNAIGKVINCRIENGEIKADAIFGSDTNSLTIFQKFADGILSDVSIGYQIDEVIETSRKDQPPHVLVTKYRILELSAVWKGFDSGATVGRNADKEALDIDNYTHNQESINLLALAEREIQILKRKAK